MIDEQEIQKRFNDWMDEETDVPDDFNRGRDKRINIIARLVVENGGSFAVGGYGIISYGRTKEGLTGEEARWLTAHTNAMDGFVLAVGNTVFNRIFQSVNEAIKKIVDEIEKETP